MTRCGLVLLLAACGAGRAPSKEDAAPPARSDAALSGPLDAAPPVPDAAVAAIDAADVEPMTGDVARLLRAVRTDCVADRDCTITRRGCCGCADLPARADYARTLSLAFERACLDMSCPAVLDERPICDARPVCKAGRCTAELVTASPPLPE